MICVQGNGEDQQQGTEEEGPGENDVGDGGVPHTRRSDGIPERGRDDGGSGRGWCPALAGMDWREGKGIYLVRLELLPDPAK